MKKILFSLALVASLLVSYQAKAVNTTLAVSAANMTNLVNGSAKVTTIIVTSPANNTTSLTFVDTPTNSLTFTNVAYTNIISYATNYIQTWTNYYGRTNSWTNIALVDVTNTVAAVTNNYNVEFQLTVPTNTTVTIPNVNAVFQYGVWVTNTAGGTATITVQY